MQRVRCAYAECQAAKSAVGGGVRVRADNQQPRLRQAKLWRNHMHDALLRMKRTKVRQAIRLGIALKTLKHSANRQVSNSLHSRAAMVGLHVMISTGQHLMRSMHGPTSLQHGVERMTSTLMEQQVIAVKQMLPHNFGDLMAPPDLVK